MGECAENLFRCGPAATAAAFEKRAGCTFVRYLRVPLHRRTFRQDFFQSLLVNVAQYLRGVVAEAHVAAETNSNRPFGYVCTASGKTDVRVSARVQVAERGAHAADEGHFRMGRCEGLHGSEGIGKFLPSRDELSDVSESLTADVEAVHHHRSDTAVLDEFQGFRDAGNVDFRYNEHRSSLLGGHSEGFYRLRPGAGKIGEAVVDGRIGTEKGNLDCAHAKAHEVPERVLRKKGSVGKDVYPAAFESCPKDKVMDVSQQQWLPTGEGNCADGGFPEQFFQGFSGHLRVWGGYRMAAIPPIVIAEPATLVAGSGEFVYYSFKTQHQMMLIIIVP